MFSPADSKKREKPPSSRKSLSLSSTRNSGAAPQETPGRLGARCTNDLVRLSVKQAMHKDTDTVHVTAGEFVTNASIDAGLRRYSEGDPQSAPSAEVAAKLANMLAAPSSPSTRTAAALNNVVTDTPVQSADAPTARAAACPK